MALLFVFRPLNWSRICPASSRESSIGKVGLKGMEMAAELLESFGRQVTKNRQQFGLFHLILRNQAHPFRCPCLGRFIFGFAHSFGTRCRRNFHPLGETANSPRGKQAANRSPHPVSRSPMPSALGS